MAEEKQDGQKTLVSFVVGLLIGGMLVWAFSGPTASAPETQNTDDDAEATEVVSDEDTAPDTFGNNSVNNGNDAMEGVDTEPAPALQVGTGEVTVRDQEAGLSVELDSATYPVSEGWIGVREYSNDNLGYILGVVRFSESQGLIPAEIALQRATTPGNRYAIVIFTEDGDFDFSLAGDVQIDQIFDTFVAQ